MSQMLPPGVQQIAMSRRRARYEERRAQLRHMGLVNVIRTQQRPLFGSPLRRLLEVRNRLSVSLFYVPRDCVRLNLWPPALLLSSASSHCTFLTCPQTCTASDTLQDIPAELRAAPALEESELRPIVTRYTVVTPRALAAPAELLPRGPLAESVRREHRRLTTAFVVPRDVETGDALDKSALTLRHAALGQKLIAFPDRGLIQVRSLAHVCNA